MPLLDDVRHERRWYAGTLSYTRGGLVALYVCLLTGDFFWQLRERAISPAIPLLLRHFGASDFVTAILVGFIPPMLGLCLTPIVGYRSDRARGRWGRRIPFLFLSTPPAFLSMMGLALSPLIGGRIDHALGYSSPGRTFCVLGSFAFFWILFDIASVVTNAVHGALINDVVPKEIMGRFFGFFRAASLGAGMLFNYFLLGVLEAHYVAIFAWIGVFYLICFMLMCLFVKEGEYPPAPPATDGGAMMRFFGGAMSYFAECFTHPYYLWIFLSFVLAHMAFTSINLFSLYFAQSVGMSMATYGKFSALQLGCSLIQAPILGWIADKVHPLRLTMFAVALYAILNGIAFVFVRDARMFAAAHVIVGSCSGMWLTATASLGPALLPKMKFAMFASVLLIAESVGRMVTAPIIGAILEHYNKGKPPIQREYHIMYLWSSVFIFLSFLAMLVVHKYFMSYGGPRQYVAPDNAPVAPGLEVIR